MIVHPPSAFIIKIRKEWGNIKLPRDKLSVISKHILDSNQKTGIITKF